MKSKKNILLIICTLLVFVSSAFFFVACDSDISSTDKIEILVSEDKIVSSGYNESLGALLSAVVKLKVGSVPVKIQKEITAIGNEADRLLRSYDITETQYATLTKDLSLNNTSYSVSLYNLLSDNKNDSNTTYKNFLSVNVRTLGKEVFSNYLYDLTSFMLNYTYLDKKESYETTGLFKEYMEKALYNYNTFNSKITKKDFETILADGIIIYDLLTVSSSNSFALTNTEISTLIKIPEFNNSLDTEAWSLVFTLIVDNFLDDTYVSELYDQAVKNNELDKFASKMPIVTKLIVSIQNKLDANVVSNLSGGVVDIIYELIPQLTEEEWNMLQQILTITVNSNYRTVAFNEYGQAYTTYEKNVTKYTVQDLKTATKENVDEIFEGIIANIHPAFSYGWNND